MTTVAETWPQLLAWMALLLLLLIGTPIFLCMPLWGDVTLYDLAARNVLQGGVHYRDIFDTNLPGMVWIHCGIRSLLSWRPEMIRFVDLLVYGGIVWLLVRWLHAQGLSLTYGIWTAVVLFLFYFSTTEWSHCQRDMWMLLPCLIALSMRHTQLGQLISLARQNSNHNGPLSFAIGGEGRGEEAKNEPVLDEKPPHLPPLSPETGARGVVSSLPTTIWIDSSADVSAWKIARHSLCEGLLWGAAVWIKPFVVVPALTCWLMTVVWLGASRTERRFRLLAVDAVGLLTGGLLAGGAGMAWIVWTGTWPYFSDIFFNWNLEYFASGGDFPLSDRLSHLIVRLYPWKPGCFYPWGLLHVPALIIAAVAVCRVVLLPRLNTAKQLNRLGREALMAAFYFGWFVQAVFLQKLFDYVLAPLVPLGLILIIDFICPLGRSWVRWGIALGFIAFVLYVHPLFMRSRLALWPRCWQEGSSAELRDSLRMTINSHSTGWVQLSKVKAFLTEQGASDREVLCFNNSTHPLYLEMDGLEPPTRYLHFDQLLSIFKGKHPEVRATLQDWTDEGGNRYIVSDMQAYGLGPEDAATLPIPESWKAIYPWNQPVLFRAGRYVVHEACGQVGPLSSRDVKK